MRKIGLLFPGQGTQCIGMGQSLCEHDPWVRERYAEASTILGYDLEKLCAEGPLEQLTDSRYCQPALFVHGFVAAKVLQSLRQDTMVAVSAGLSIGSLVALAVAGVYDFATGVRIAQKRGALIQEACKRTRGGMASILGVSVEQVQSLCQVTGVEMSNVNCPGQIVISGEKDRVDIAVSRTPELTGGRAIPLNVAGAFHSSLMASACPPFQEFLEPLEFHPMQWPVISNVTGQVIEDVSHIKSLLVQQIVSPVLWWQCMQTATSLGISEFYQCGPGKTLIGMAKRIDPNLIVRPFGDYDDWNG